MKSKRIYEIISTIVFLACCALTLLLEFLPVTYSNNPLHNRLLRSVVPLTVGFVAVVILAKRLGLRFFTKVEGWLYLLPCLAVAINNFQFISYFNGNMQLQTGVDTAAWIIFALYCLMTGLFEEVVFRGILFPIVAERTTNDKKGLFLAVLISSLIFGASHLFNLVRGADVGATLMQVGYTTLTGGMFAFAYIKTKNIFSSVCLHGIYNFGGLFFTETQGLGTGVVIDLPTGIMMAVVAIVVGFFVIIKTATYPDEERKRLYEMLGVRHKQEIE